MPRAVSPWTWRRALRDHGPDDAGLLLSLHTLATWMNRDGFAFPSQESWARGSRVTVRTIRRHKDKAESLGWIAVEIAGRNGQGWRHYAYRAAVPNHIRLDNLDEEIAEVIVAQNGEIERADIIVSAPCTEPTPDRTETCGHSTQKRADISSEGADTGRQNVRTQLCPTNSSQNSSSELTLRNEAQSEDCAVSLSLEGKKAEESKKVLHEGIRAIGKTGARPLRRISDEQLQKQLDKLAATGMTSLAEATKVLSGNYEDVGPARLWRIIEANRTARSRGVVV